MLLATAALGAQEVTSTITGHITTKKNEPIAGATLRIAGASLMGERVVRTGADGAYRVPLLPGGNYVITVTADGYIGTKIDLRIAAGGTIKQDAALRSQAELTKDQGTTVEVVASATQRDKTEIGTQTAFSQETLSNLTGADPYGVLSLAPGVAGTDVTHVSIRGGGQQGANYMVDGMAAYDGLTSGGRLDMFTLSDLIESTSVIQSPLNAKTGNTSSGIVAQVTRRGSNEFKGSIRAKLSKGGDVAGSSFVYGSWVANDTPLNNRLGVANATSHAAYVDSLNRTYEVTVSGPIIPNKLTFTYGTRLTPDVLSSATAYQVTSNGGGYVPFGGVNYRAETYQEGGTRYFTAGSTFNQYSLFYQINDNHQVEYKFAQVDKSQAATTIGSSPQTGLSGNDTFSQQLYGLTYHGIIGNNQILEIRYGVNRSDSLYFAGPNPPITLYSGTTSNTNLISMYGQGKTYLLDGGTADIAPDSRKIRSILVNYNAFKEWHGQHIIDAGFERQEPIWGTPSRGPSYPLRYYIPGQIANSLGGTLGGQFIVFNKGATAANLGGTGSVNVALIPRMQILEGLESATVTSPNDSFYLNDLWTPNQNWSVMAGLRYDHLKISDPEGVKADAKTWSPRFELKYDLFGDQSRVVNFSYGQFRGIVNGRSYRNFVVTRLEQATQKYWIGIAPTGNPNAPYLVDYNAIHNAANYEAQGSTFVNHQSFKIDPSFKPELNTEITLGFRRNLSKGGWFSLALIQRKYTDLGYAQPDISGSIRIYNVADPSITQQSYRRTLKNDPDGFKMFRSMEYEFQLPLSQRFSIGGNYTWAKSIGNNLWNDDQGASSNQGYTNSGDFRESYRAMGYTDSQFRPTGILPNSVEHTGRLQFSYALTKGKWTTSLSLQGTYASGLRESLISKVTTTPAGSSIGVSMVPGLTSSADIPTMMPMYWNGRGAFTAPDTYNWNLQYNVKVALKNKLELETQIRVNNVFNHLYQSTVTGRSSAYYSGTSLSNTTNSNTGSVVNTTYADIYNGYRMDGAQAKTWGTANYPAGMRYVTADVILRF
jgi:hypothetical protein